MRPGKGTKTNYEQQKNMTDYSEVYIEINQVLKSYYNHETKNNHERAAQAANEVATLAEHLKFLAEAKL